MIFRNINMFMTIVTNFACEIPSGVDLRFAHGLVGIAITNECNGCGQTSMFGTVICTMGKWAPESLRELR